MIRTTFGTNGSQACAVCKYQRRKCTPNCPLAPYFPANQHNDFMNAHKLFGVSNIMKIIKNLNPQQRAIAMKSIIFQANMRARDPVGGCLRYINYLQTQIDDCQTALNFVLQHLAICKSKARCQSKIKNIVHKEQTTDVPNEQQGSSSLSGLVCEQPGSPKHHQEDNIQAFQAVGLNVVIQEQGNVVDEDIKPLHIDGCNEKAAAPFSKPLTRCSYKVKKEGGQIQQDDHMDVPLKNWVE